MTSLLDARRAMIDAMMVAAASLPERTATLLVRAAVDLETAAWWDAAESQRRAWNGACSEVVAEVEALPRPTAEHIGRVKGVAAIVEKVAETRVEAPPPWSISGVGDPAIDKDQAARIRGLLKG